MSNCRMPVFGILFAAFITGCFSAPCRAEDRVGMIEDCSTADGWYEWGKGDARIPPRAKMEAKDGLLSIHTNRGLLFALDKYQWPIEGVVESSSINKDYPEVDLDKYHYLVMKIKAKGSGAQLTINNLGTKLGYTTGITAIDLKDYDDKSVQGRQKVHLRINLHDNLTTLILDEIKLVSELNDEEKKGFIDAGLTIRDENLKFRDFHGLNELKRRQDVALPDPAGEEMAIFRDSATGAITTRMTFGIGDTYPGEGEIWSADGAAIKFSTKRKMDGPPVYYLGDGRLATMPKSGLALWSNVEPTKMFLVSGKRVGEKGTKPWKFTVSWWDHKTGELTPITEFISPEVGEYFEVKRVTRSGKLIVAFRETPHMFIVDPVEKKATHVELSTRLKDSAVSADERYVTWFNCYTYENRWRDLKTGEEGLSSGEVVGHACGGPNGTVGSFGPYLKLLIPLDIGRMREPGDKIKIWANWQNRVYTDYGNFTADQEWIFTNGIQDDVDHQHLMVPSKDTGAVLRIARYFTKFSWTSPTYNRPSPDYTKLVYCDNGIGSAQLYMVYTRRTDSPQDFRLVGKTLTWTAPKRRNELKGYNVYQSKASGRDFVKINDKLITGTSLELKDNAGFFAVTAVENSLLESMFSQEVSTEKAVTRYFEAEDMKLTPPARRFYDGYSNGFQCVRINAESAAEKSRDGVIELDSAFTQGPYSVWALVKGKGTWTVAGESTAVDTAEWKWVKLFEWQAQDKFDAKPAPLKFSSRDDGLMLDTVMLTTEDFKPAASDPRDSTPPQKVANLQAKSDTTNGYVSLTWDRSPAADLHHYSIYCGTSKDFTCDNATLIRSVLKNSVTDAGMEPGKKLYYKVVAYDSRWNASEPATVEVQPLPTPTSRLTGTPAK